MISKPPIYELYELLKAKKNLENNLTSSIGRKCSKESMNYAVKKIYDKDQNVDFKNFYKQFSLEDDNTNDKALRDKNLNKGEKAAQFIKDNMVKLKAKAKEYFKKFLKYLNDLIAKIAAKNLRKSLIKTREVLEKGDNLELLSQDFAPIRNIVIANICRLSSLVSFKLIEGVCDRVTRSSDKALIEKCIHGTQVFKDTFEDLVKRIEPVSKRRKQGDIEAGLKELVNILNVFESKGVDDDVMSFVSEPVKELTETIRVAPNKIRSSNDIGVITEQIDRILSSDPHGKTILPIDEKYMTKLNNLLNSVDNKISSDNDNKLSNFGIFLSNLMFSSGKFTQMYPTLVSDFCSDITKIVSDAEKEKIKNEKNESNKIDEMNNNKGKPKSKPSSV